MVHLDMVSSSVWWTFSKLISSYCARYKGIGCTTIVFNIHTWLQEIVLNVTITKSREIQSDFRSEFCWFFIVGLLMQHNFPCVHLIRRSWTTWKNETNNTYPYTSWVMPHSNYELFNNLKERDCIRPAYILLRMSMFLRLGAFRARIESWVKLMSARRIGNSPHVKCFAPHHDLQEESINFRLKYKSEKMTHGYTVTC